MQTIGKIGKAGGTGIVIKYANKKIESWLFWIVGDIITVPLYSYRGLGILSLQYLIFLILAIQGYFEWKKTLNKQSQTV